MSQHAPVWLTRTLAAALLFIVWALGVSFVMSEPPSPIPHADVPQFAVGDRGKR